MRIKANGEMAWPGGSVTLSSVQSSKMHFDRAELYNNQMVFAWGDSRSGNGDIYAQNLLSNGNLGPAAAPGSISGTLSFVNGTSDVTLASISAGGSAVNPDTDGQYTLILEEGTYTVVVEHPYTETIEIENVDVVSGETTQLDLQLEVVRTDLTVYAINQDGEPLSPVTISIEGPEGVYNGTIEADFVTFVNVPYGSYAGTASFDIHTVDDEVYINMDNQEMTFVFPFTGLSTLLEHSHTLVSPNPISSESILTIHSSEITECQLIISDSRGSFIATPKNWSLQSGRNIIKVTELTEGKLLAPGIYVLNIIIHNEVTRLKLVVAL